jgi:biopolymer transport protein ExbB
LLTDDFGRFTITNVDTGSYRVEITDNNERGANAVLLDCRITPVDTLVIIPTGVLQPVGSLHGEYASLPAPASTVYLQLYGLDRVARIDTTTRSFIFDNVPAGYYSAAITADSSGAQPIAALNHIVVASGIGLDCGAIDFQSLNSWRYSRRIYLNTTPNGAYVAATVMQFPVLVRLSSGNFQFSQAQRSGADLRFAKPDGAPLPFEIEQWDAANAQASIWVKADTVYGNDSAHFFTMYWGAPVQSTGSGTATTSLSNGAAVFDTANGFQGVWHMDEPVAALAKDATINNYNGTPSDTAPTPVAGVIGMAQEFSGPSNFIQMHGTANSNLDFPQSGNYTVSAWVYVDTFDSKYHLIAGKGHEQYYLKVKCFGGSALWEFDEYENKTGWAYTEVGNPPDSKVWVYLAGVRSGPLQQLFVNGVLALDTFGIMAGTLPRNSSDDFTIGKYLRPVTVPYVEGYCPFNGKIDEVCVSSRSRGADWIKLCYMNQRTDDKLVVFK